MNFVIDASVAIKWFVEEDLTEAALRLLEREEPFCAPDLIVAEVTNIAWKKVIRGEIERGQASDIMDSIQESSVMLHSSVPLNARALEIALDLKHPVYDCLYIACAEAVGDGCMVTADGRLCAAVADTAYAGLAVHLSTIVAG